MNENSGFFKQPEIEDLTQTGGLGLLYESSAGYTQIWRGEKAGKFMAYKALKPEFRGELLYENLLIKDFNIGFSLDHPNVCRYYGFINLPEIGNAIEMEWIDGRTLNEYSKEERPNREERKRIASEICKALAYIHRRHIIHRDLKPANILITNNGNFVKIIDFGLSDSDSYATLKASAGTLSYAAPELLGGVSSSDIRIDIWSLGKILAEFAPEYKAISRRCMSSNPGNRYENAERVLRAIKSRNVRKFTFATIFAILISAAVICLVPKCSHSVEVEDDVVIEEAAPIEEPIEQRVTEDVTEEMIENPAPTNQQIYKARPEKKINQKAEQGTEQGTEQKSEQPVESIETQEENEDVSRKISEEVNKEAVAVPEVTESSGNITETEEAKINTEDLDELFRQATSIIKGDSE